MRLSLARHRGVDDAGRSVEHAGSRAVLARTPVGVLALQRAIGNRAVRSMLDSEELILPAAGPASAGAAGAAGAAAAGAAGAASAGAAGAAAGGAAGAASAGAAGAQIGAFADPDLVEFELRSPRRLAPR